MLSGSGCVEVRSKEDHVRFFAVEIGWNSAVDLRTQLHAIRDRSFSHWMRIHGNISASIRATSVGLFMLHLL